MLPARETGREEGREVNWAAAHWSATCERLNESRSGVSVKSVGGGRNAAARERERVNEQVTWCFAPSRHYSYITERERAHICSYDKARSDSRICVAACYDTCLNVLCGSANHSHWQSQ